MTSSPVDGACQAIGLDSSDVLSTRPVGGGCINEGIALRTTRGNFFLKWNRRAGHRFFQVEAEGLEALAASDAVRVPAVVARSGTGDEVAWLLLEWIEEGRPGRESWNRLGRELAALHRGTVQDRRFGWHSDNLHREVDLAMTELFGGFAPAFRQGYNDAWPLLAGYRRRRSAYQLYPLLVHARLFGGGYAASATAAARAALAGRP